LLARSVDTSVAHLVHSFGSFNGLFSIWLKTRSPLLEAQKPVYTPKIFIAQLDRKGIKLVKTLIGTKLGMTTIINDNGTAQAVTVIQAGPMTVTQVRTAEKDGYSAAQLGYQDSKKVAKPQAGHLKAAKVMTRILKEFRITDEQAVAVGDSFDVDVFTVGDRVKVSGVSKGKGWSGTIKRHNFHRQRKSHGAKGNTRRPGSIGSMYPQKIFKGKKMAGRSGGATQQHTLGITGAVPGPRKGIVTVEAL
jgi:large subunit ribosomal protein L3